MNTYKLILFRFATVLTVFFLLYGCNEEVIIDEVPEILVPEVLSFYPQQARIGDEVNIVGENLIYTDKVYVGDSSVSIKSKVNDTLLIVQVPVGTKSGLIKVVNEQEEGVASTDALTIIYSQPVLSVIPEGGQINEEVVIEGENLEYINQLILGETEATIVSQTTSELVFTVPFILENQVTLSYTYSKEQGTQTVTLEENGFNVLKSWPTINSIPKAGMINTEIVIIGENMNVVDSVYIGSFKAEIISQDALTITIVIPDLEVLEGYQAVTLYSYGGQEVKSDPVLRVMTKLEKLLEDFESFDGDPVVKKKDVLPTYETGLNLDPGLTAPEGNFYASMKLVYDQTQYNNSGSTYAEFYYKGENNLIDLSEFSDPWIHIWINTNNTSPYFVFYCDLAETVDGVTKGTHYVKRVNSADYGEGWQLFAWRMSDLQFRASSSADPYTSDVFSIYNLKTFRIQFRTSSTLAEETSEFHFDSFMVVEGKMNAAIDATTFGN